MKKIIPLILILSVAMGTLFYFSNISFQLDAFRWKPWAVEVLFMLIIGAAGGFMVIRHKRRFNKRNNK